MVNAVAVECTLYLARPHIVANEGKENGIRPSAPIFAVKFSNLKIYILQQMNRFCVVLVSLSDR